jgi:hypothetical protein
MLCRLCQVSLYDTNWATIHTSAACSWGGQIWKAGRNAQSASLFLGFIRRICAILDLVQDHTHPSSWQSVRRCGRVSNHAHLEQRSVVVINSNPRSWVPEASMLTTRPPKGVCYCCWVQCWCSPLYTNLALQQLYEAHRFYCSSAIAVSGAVLRKWRE